MARYLVTGGAGYIGSHIVLALVERGDEVVIIDDLRRGHRAAVPSGVELITVDLANVKQVAEVFAAWRFQGVLHFAALSMVQESMREPLTYLGENVGNTILLAQQALRAGCDRFVLSSTAALFGMPDAIPIGEEAPIRPISAYGESKWMAERSLAWARQVHGLRFAALRYFNAAGADPKGRLGEDHEPESHLIPLAIDAALGRRPELTVFGMDYPTPDGTCIRDYVHVTDLADAHLRTLDYLDLEDSGLFNVGSGSGFSVLEIINMVERVGGRPVPHRFGPRREGDPAVLIAASEKLKAATGWQSNHGSLEQIIGTAWDWRLAHPNGYADN